MSNPIVLVSAALLFLLLALVAPTDPRCPG